MGENRVFYSFDACLTSGHGGNRTIGGNTQRASSPNTMSETDR